jgi:hypothetical protein
LYFVRSEFGCLLNAPTVTKKVVRCLLVRFRAPLHLILQKYG